MAAVSVRCHDVTSIPQGWHPMNGPVKNDLPIKKPVAAPRTPKSPAPPAAKPPNSTSATKTPAVNGNQAPKEPRGRSPNASARMATEKLRQEAAALQKRVAQFRLENQGLKSKVKRLEEDCVRKSRQVDKLAQAAKDKVAAAQEQKKGDDALKQKCAKLEMQLKEKEDKLKKLQAIQRRSSENATPEKIHPAKSRLTNSQPRGSSAELVKLREQMDRISQENRRLSFQLKEKEQEIRRLKSQLQPAAPTKTPVKTPTRTPTRTPVPSRTNSQRPASSNRVGSAATETRKSVATAKRSNTFSVTRGPPQPDDKTETSEISVESRSTPLNNYVPCLRQDVEEEEEEDSSMQAKPSSSAMSQKKPQQSSASSNSSREASAHVAAVGASKPTATVKPAASNPLPNPKAEVIRRNTAARKIQRVWRQHRRRASPASLAGSELSETSNLSQGSQLSLKAKPVQQK